MSELPEGVYVHDSAICEATAVGEGTRIWAFSHVLPKATIGRDCNICEHVFIENEVRVGDSVTIKCGVYLWDGIEIGNQVFIGPNATFTNDKFPRSKQYPEQFMRTVVEDGASIAANATILPGIRIGRNAMVGAGAVVTHDVPPNAIVMGVPAKITGYVGMERFVEETSEALEQSEPVGSKDCKVEGVRFHTLKVVDDMRGSLTVGEFERQIPFAVRRYFMVFNVPSAEVRGEHAHKACEQFLICVSGSVRVIADDSQKREEFLLDQPQKGLHLPPGVWGVQYRFSSDAVLLVFASDYYDPDDYIRDYQEFLDYRKALPMDG